MMNPQKDRSPKKSIHKVRAITGMAMGVFYFFVAYWVVYMERIEQIHIGETFSYLAATLMVLYGLFRIYRGYLILKNEAKN